MTFVVLAAKLEGEEPARYVVTGGKVTTSDLAVEHFKWANRFANEAGEPTEWFSVVKESEKPVSLDNVDPMPAPLASITKK